MSLPLPLIDSVPPAKRHFAEDYLKSKAKTCTP